MEQDYCTFIGNRNTLIPQFQKLGIVDRYHSTVIIDCLLKYYKVSDKSLIKIIHLSQDSEDNDASLLIRNGRYYVNVKTLLIIFVAYLFDIAIGNGPLTVIISSLGLSRQCIKSLDSHNGERCVVMEAVLNNGQADESLLSRYKQLCNKPYINCMYQLRGNEKCSCLCNKTEIVKILDYLTTMHIFKKNNNIYKYQI